MDVVGVSFVNGAKTRTHVISLVNILAIHELSDIGI